MPDGTASGRTGAPLVVLVPGLGLDHREWQASRRGLAEHSVVLPLPSMGVGAPRGTDLTVEAHAQRVLRVLPRGRPVVLVGHSASCAVVVEVARLATDTGQATVRGLVLVGPVTDPRAATWPRMVARWLRSARHERVVEVRTLGPQYSSTGVSSILRGMDAIRRYRTDRGLGPVPVPTEVVRGEHDRIAPPEWCFELADGDGDRVTTVAGAGHMVPLTHPAAVAAAVRRVLARPAAPEVPQRTRYAGTRATANTRRNGSTTRPSRSG